MKLKVCGMKYEDNITQIAALQPDYLGFIFWKPSKRFFEGPMPIIADSIKKIGVFVDASVSEVVHTIGKYNLQGVQLHGSESPEYCQALREVELFKGPFEGVSNKYSFDIIKAFSIKDDFDFSQLKAYESVCDYFLFDTKGALPGGNGFTFNWEVLKKYTSTTPFFLSGGIGLEEKEKVAAFLKTAAAKYCHAIDVNSRFELRPGEKDIQKIKEFKTVV